MRERVEMGKRGEQNLKNTSLLNFYLVISESLGKEEKITCGPHAHTQRVCVSEMH